MKAPERGFFLEIFPKKVYKSRLVIRSGNNRQRKIFSV